MDRCIMSKLYCTSCKKETEHSFEVQKLKGSDLFVVDVCTICKNNTTLGEINPDDIEEMIKNAKLNE